MAKNTQEEMNTIDQLNSKLTSAGEKVANNKNMILWAVCILVITGACIMAYLFLFSKPREQKAMDAYATVETTAMGNDSIAVASYTKIADKYKGTDGGNLAALDAAEALYRQGKYEEAVKYLDKFSTSDDVLGANSEILAGDCYVNLKKYDKAIEHFEKAVKTCDNNPQIAPRALMKMATVYDAQKKYDKALNCYETISTDYPQFQLGNGMTIDAYIAREKARLGK